MSLPVRECGLKYAMCWPPTRAISVTPCAGVWIEIGKQGRGAWSYEMPVLHPSAPRSFGRAAKRHPWLGSFKIKGRHLHRICSMKFTGKEINLLFVLHLFCIRHGLKTFLL